MHSSVLGAACTGEQDFVDLSAEDEQCVEALVSYLYSFKYDPGLASGDTSFHLKMDVLAEKYDIPPLKTIAAETFKQSANQNLLSYDKEGFCKALRSVYDSPRTTEAMRKHMIDLLMKNNFMAYAAKYSNSPFQVAMRSNADLATDIAIALATKYAETTDSDNMLRPMEKRVKCPSCSRSFVCALPDTNAQTPEFKSCNNCGVPRSVTQWRTHVLDES